LFSIVLHFGHLVYFGEIPTEMDHYIPFQVKKISMPTSDRLTFAELICAPTKVSIFLGVDS